jgi:hypothetical protein
MKLGRTACAFLVAAILAPGTVLAHDGDRDGFRHHHHHRGVLLKGTVSSIDTAHDTLVVKVARATRGANALEGDSVTVKVVKGWIADTNDDGNRSIADVQVGDTVLVFTKRRFVDADANNVSAAFVLDKTHPAHASAWRDGDCDHR